MSDISNDAVLSHISQTLDSLKELLTAYLKTKPESAGFSLPQPKAEATTEIKAEATETVNPDKEPPISADEVIRVLSKIATDETIGKAGKKIIQDALGAFGAKKASDVPEDQRKDLLCRAVGGYKKALQESKNPYAAAQLRGFDAEEGGKWDSIPF